MDAAVRARATDDPITEAEAQRLFAGLAAFPKLLLCVSGGPDSTALLWLLARWRDALAHPPQLIAVTVDHGLREESAREARAVKRLARRLEVEHHTLRWTGRKPRTGIQEAARAARYRLVANLARRLGAEQILTGHTRDDQAETVLMRLVRGSGVGGLAGMRPFGPMPVPAGPATSLVRPLLRVPKARLIATLDAARVPYVEDPTNRNAAFTRPRLRALMPSLSREGLTADRLALLARRVDRVEIALDDALNETLRRVVPGPWPDKGPIAIDATAFTRLPEEIGLRLLGRLVDWCGDEGPVELAKLEALHAALVCVVDRALPGANGPPYRRTLAGAMVTLSSGRLRVERAPPRRAGGKTRRPKGSFTKAR